MLFSLLLGLSMLNFSYEKKVMKREIAPGNHSHHDSTMGQHFHQSNPIQLKGSSSSKKAELGHIDKSPKPHPVETKGRRRTAQHRSAEKHPAKQYSPIEHDHETHAPKRPKSSDAHQHHQHDNLAGHVGMHKKETLSPSLTLHSHDEDKESPRMVGLRFKAPFKTATSQYFEKIPANAFSKSTHVLITTDQSFSGCSVTVSNTPMSKSGPQRGDPFKTGPPSKRSHSHEPKKDEKMYKPPDRSKLLGRQLSGLVPWLDSNAHEARLSYADLKKDLDIKSRRLLEQQYLLEATKKAEWHTTDNLAKRTRLLNLQTVEVDRKMTLKKQLLEKEKKLDKSIAMKENLNHQMKALFQKNAEVLEAKRKVVEAFKEQRRLEEAANKQNSCNTF